MSKDYIAAKDPEVKSLMTCPAGQLIEIKRPANGTDWDMVFSSASRARDFAKACLKVARNIEQDSATRPAEESDRNGHQCPYCDARIMHYEVLSHLQSDLDLGRLFCPDTSAPIVCESCGEVMRLSVDWEPVFSRFPGLEEEDGE